MSLNDMLVGQRYDDNRRAGRTVRVTRLLDDGQLVELEDERGRRRTSRAESFTKNYHPHTNGDGPMPQPAPERSLFDVPPDNTALAVLCNCERHLDMLVQLVHEMLHRMPENEEER